MIKHIWTVVCKEAKVDAMSNNVSIIDAYENLQFDINTDDPNYRPGASIAVPFSFEVVSLFFRDATGTQAELEEAVLILDPKGQQLGEVISNVQFTEESDRMRNILQFNIMALTTSGTYLFQVFTRESKQATKKKLVTAIPVNVTVHINGQHV